MVNLEIYSGLRSPPKFLLHRAGSIERISYSPSSTSSKLLVSHMDKVRLYEIYQSLLPHSQDSGLELGFQTSKAMGMEKLPLSELKN